MLKFSIIALCLSFVMWMACKNDEPARRPLNPNGDSELAILMRDMFDEGMIIKQDLIAGKKPELHVKYHHLTTAKPTEEGKNATTEYALFAKAYEASIERLRNAGDDDRLAAYHNMVDNCVNCHKTVCPGPIVRIKKMYLSEEEIKLATSE